MSLLWFVSICKFPSPVWTRLVLFTDSWYMLCPQEWFSCSASRHVPCTDTLFKMQSKRQGSLCRLFEPSFLCNFHFSSTLPIDSSNLNILEPHYLFPWLSEPAWHSFSHKPPINASMQKAWAIMVFWTWMVFNFSCSKQCPCILPWVSSFHFLQKLFKLSFMD